MTLGPSSNGMAERAVQTVKHGVKKMTSGTLRDKLARNLLISVQKYPRQPLVYLLLNFCLAEGSDPA